MSLTSINYEKQSLKNETFFVKILTVCIMNFVTVFVFHNSVSIKK